MQQHKHSCIQQVQEVYQSASHMPSQTTPDASSWNTQSKWALEVEEAFVDLSQVALALVCWSSIGAVSCVLSTHKLQRLAKLQQSLQYADHIPLRSTLIHEE